MNSGLRPPGPEPDYAAYSGVFTVDGKSRVRDYAPPAEGPVAVTAVRGWASRAFGSAASLFGALLLTAALFLILPILQLITEEKRETRLVKAAMATETPPPPPPVEEESEPEPDPEPPPELEEPEPQPLSMDMLDVALGGGGGSGAGIQADLSINMDNVIQQGGGDDMGFGGLGQRAKKLSDPNFNIPPAAKSAVSGKTIYAKLRISPSGTVEQVLVENCSNPTAKAAIVRALKRMRFSPAKRGGKAVADNVRFPFTFP